MELCVPAVTGSFGLRVSRTLIDRLLRCASPPKSISPSRLVETDIFFSLLDADPRQGPPCFPSTSSQMTCRVAGCRSPVRGVVRSYSREAGLVLLSCSRWFEENRAIWTRRVDSPTPEAVPELRFLAKGSTSGLGLESSLLSMGIKLGPLTTEVALFWRALARSLVSEVMMAAFTREKNGLSHSSPWSGWRNLCGVSNSSS